MKYKVLNLVFLNLLSLSSVTALLSVFESNPSFAENVSSEKFNDFYNHKKVQEKRDEVRESSRLKYVTSRKSAEQRYENLEDDFAKKNNRQRQELKDEFAENWMEKQNQQHNDNLDEARKKYILSQKKNYKYTIPESEEFEIK